MNRHFFACCTLLASAALWPAHASAAAATDAACIGAFVYDKRGSGGSSGRYTQKFLTLANDAIAALTEARRLAGSQGGWVAPLAAKIEPVDFVVVSFGLAVSPLDEDRAAIVA